MNDVLQKLAAPFPADEIEWRIGTSTPGGKALVLAYITARHVMDRLDKVVGPSNWQDRYEFHGPRTVCYLSVRVGDEWITKADAAGDSAVEKEKGSVSDALKRAAVKWGIARYLYDLDNIWADYEVKGKSKVIKKTEFARLEKLLNHRFATHSKASDRSVEDQEIDANQQNNSQPDNKPQEKPRLSKNEEAREIFTTLQDQLRELTDDEQIKSWWNKSFPLIKRLPDDWAFNIRDMVASQRQEIQAKEKEAA